MTTQDEISSLLEEVRVRGMRAATYATEAQRRHQAEAIDMLVVQALKLIEAEWNALLCEIHDAEKAADAALVSQTSERERLRIAASQPETRWLER